MSLARRVAWINSRQGWRTLFWAGVLTGSALLLDFLPLVDVLGYDFAFVLGWVAALAAVDVGHGVVTGARRCGRAASPVRLAGEAVATALTLLALPLLLSLANALRVRNCNLGAGLAFFALLPVGTAVFAGATSASVAVAIPGRRLGRIAAFGLVVFSVGWALLRLYRDPAVFAFDPFGGYFPGPIYDEAMRPPLRLLWFRFSNLTWAAAAVAVASWGWRASGGRPRFALRPFHQPAIALVLVAGSLLWFEARGALGIHVTHADLAKLLPRLTQTAHFELRSDPAAESDADINLAAEDLEFRYHQLVRVLGVLPPGTIRVYRFPSAAAKKDAVGAANTLYAKPWTREIFVQADRYPAQRLRHELAHVFAAAFGDRVFGVALAWRLPWPTLASGLIEGLAEAADGDNPSGRSTLHEETAAMLALGEAPALRQALGSGFTFESGPRAYTMVGSFCRFLLERYGPEKLRALYHSAGDFTGVYGRNLSTLDKEWRAFLATLPTDDRVRGEAEEDFRRPAIFHKVCARELAARVAEARAHLGTAPGESVSLLTSACADDPGEPTLRLDLAEALIAAGEPARALTILAEARARGALTRPLRGRAANLEAGIHFRAGRLAETKAVLAQALAAATEDGDERFATARRRAIADPCAAATLGRVLFGDERGQALDPALAMYLLTEFARQNPGEALGPYLLARQLATRDPKLAWPRLLEACPLSGPEKPEPLDATFTKECRRMLGETAYLAGELPTARDALTWLADHGERVADRLRARDWLERVTWKAATPMLQPAATSGGTTSPHDRIERSERSDRSEQSDRNDRAQVPARQ
jgi:hypothetical protein